MRGITLSLGNLKNKFFQLCFLPSYYSNASPMMNLSSYNLFYQKPSENLGSKQIGFRVAKNKSPKSSSTTVHALDSEEISLESIHPIYNWF
jgi:hypothetical protein